MKLIRKLPDAEFLREELSLTEVQKKQRDSKIEELQAVLSGKSKKKIVCVGPCSADREDVVLEYMNRLAVLADEIKESIVVVPRIYTSKPRTSGKGYKGMVHRPIPEKSSDDIYDGIRATRQLHLRVIQQTGLYGADEMLYPEAFYYICDLLAYTAVGARSVENQQHRLVASGLDMPVGMKNPTSGDVDVMLNAVYAAQSRQALLYHGYECRTEGNPYAHTILRGYTDHSGKIHSNYHYEDICDVYDKYVTCDLKNIATIVDCNHSNSRKHYDEQPRIAKEIFRSTRDSTTIDSFVKGVMIESYLVDGCQMIGEEVYGKSITDPCLGWEKTEVLIKELAELIG